jgi:hypothetical protein
MDGLRLMMFSYIQFILTLTGIAMVLIQLLDCQTHLGDHALVLPA